MINIKKYKESDAPALWAIFYHTIHNVNICNYSKAQVEAWAPDEFDPEIWQRKMNFILPFAAKIENGLIDHFFCHYKYQGKGIGRSLMEHVISISQLEGISKLYSEVSITARPFYEKFGFKAVREQIVAVHGQKLCNFAMERFSE